MPLPSSFPDLATLDLFASVIAMGSVNQAARAHGLSQPSATARLNTMERQLGVTLLERGPKGSKPTPVGLLVGNWVETLLQSARELLVGVDALRAQSQGQLRIIASYTIAEYLLPAWLTRFRNSNQGVPVRLEVANSTDVLTTIRVGGADLGFIESPGGAVGLSSSEVSRDELVVVVAPDHPWARREHVEAKELTSTPLVLREKGSGTRDYLERALNEARLPAPKAAIELGSTSAIKASVSTGPWPSVLSALAVTTEVANGTLCALSVHGVVLSRSLRAVWRSDLPLPAAAKSLLTMLSATAGTPTGRSGASGPERSPAG